MKPPRDPSAPRRVSSLASRLAILGALSSLGALVAPAQAAPTDMALRYQVDQHGDVVLFGNTGGFDCRMVTAKAPDPVVGTVDRNNCGNSIEDSSPDVLWRADEPGLGAVKAGIDVRPKDARTTSVLVLPPGATVSYARIYWSTSLGESVSASNSVLVERPGPGGFAPVTVTANPKDILEISGGSSSVFQASADITKIVQTYGPGAYRVSNYASSEIVNVGQDVLWAAWSSVVLYEKPGDPLRNLTVYDGLVGVGPNSTVQQTLSGFIVPVTGAPQGRLAVIAYEGDSDKTGDSLNWNGAPLTDAQNPADNFFNSTRGSLGQKISTQGDLPQLTGEPNSMASLDLDLVDLSGVLKPGDTSATVSATVTSDVIYLGAFVTSIVSHKPALVTTLTYPPGSDTRPGSVIEFTSTTKNVGDDPAKGTVIEHTLPPGLTYVPGSTRFVQGPNQGGKTDVPADDQVDYDPIAHKLTIRIGTGADGSTGGQVNPQDPAKPNDPANPPIVIKYQVRVDDNAPPGDIPTQSQTKATSASNPGAGTLTYTSGDGLRPGQPTIVTVPPCGTNADCAIGAPVCDLTSSPHRCQNTCTNDTSCIGAAGGKAVCDPVSMTCGQCSANSAAACKAQDGGTVCLPGQNRCGCQSDADCGGRRCDLATNSCPKPTADLTVEVSVSPNPATVDQPVVYDIDVLNHGPGTAPAGVVVTYNVPAGGTITSVNPGPGWRCTTSDRTVTCTDNQPIGPNVTTPHIQITVTPDPATSAGPDGGGDPSIHSTTSVTSDGSVDPNPADNSVDLVTALGHYRTAGGGFSCSIATRPSTFSFWAGAAMALAIGLLLRRRRSRSAV